MTVLQKNKLEYCLAAGGLIGAVIFIFATVLLYLCDKRRMVLKAEI